MKKTLLGLVASALVVASTAVVCSAAGFSDVPENSWYKQYVDYTVSKELMNGVSDDEFAPNSNFTVAQCVTVAARLNSKMTGKTIPEGKENWYDGYVEYCIEQGIIEKDSFADYNVAISRSDSAKIFANAVDSEKLQKINDIKGIPDVAPDDEYFDCILALYNAGVFGGSDDVGSFMPDSQIKRSELSAILSRLDNESMRVKNEIPYSGFPRYLIDDHVMTGKWGLQSGWDYDVKYSLKNTNGYESFSISSESGEKVGLYRPVNVVKDGNAIFDTSITFSGKNIGAYVALEDTNNNPVVKVYSKNNAFYIQAGTKTVETKLEVCANVSETHAFVFDVDLKKKICNVTIDASYFANIPIDVKEGIARLAIAHDGTGMGALTVNGARCVADYRVNDNFRASPVSVNKGLVGEWKTTGDVTVGELLSERGADIYSAKAKGNSTASKKFEKIGAQFCVEANVLLPKNTSSLSLYLTKENDKAFEIVTKDGFFISGGKELRAIPYNVWTNIRIEADLHSATAFIRINGKDCGTVPFKAEYVDGIGFATQGEVWFDDVKVFGTYNYKDYPEEPKAVNEGGYDIGINVCNLWRNGTCDEGYDAIAPFDELHPLVGLADEGLPELADIEVKQMAEHGIDFQHICWYSPQQQTKAPIKGISMPQLALNDGYLKAKYSEYVKFCIMWENGNGSVQSVQQFKDYLWPYFKEYYLSDSRYYTINNRPLITIWSTTKFQDSFGGASNAKAIIDFMDHDIKSLGYDGIYVWFMNSSSPLENIKNVGGHAGYSYNYGKSGENADYQIKFMEDKLKDNATFYIPSVSVGFNDVGRHDTRSGLITDEGHEEVCKYIRDVYLPAAFEDNPFKNCLMVSTWNEYSEGTYIAPNNYNGFEYLDNIREYFTDAPKDHVDEVPSEKVKDRLRNIYPDGYSPIRRYRLEEDPGKTVEGLLKKSKKALSWSFDNEEHVSHWRISHGINKLNVNEKSISGTSTEVDYGITLNKEHIVQLDAENDNIIFLHVRMKSDVYSRADLFFTCEGDKTFTSQKMIKWDVEKSDEMVDYYVDLRSINMWRGIVNNFRFDPMGTPGTFEVELIEFLSVPEDENKISVFFDENLMEFNFEPIYDNKLGDILVTANPRLGFFSMSHTFYKYNKDKGQVYVESLNSDVLLTVGSSKCLVSGKEVDLGYEFYLKDGLPVVPLVKFMKLLGFDCEKQGNTYNFSTLDEKTKEMLKSAGEGVWEFSSQDSILGWKTNNCTGVLADGCFVLEGTDADTFIYAKDLDIDLDKTGFTKVTVGIKYDTQAERAVSQLFFVAGSVTSFKEAASARVRSESNTTNGKFVELVFDMSGNEHWCSKLTQLRFDPFNGLGTYSIDYIRLS